MSSNYDFHVSEDISFQRRLWRIERIGWAVLALIVAGAVLGILGRGILSKTTIVSEDGGIRVTYERVARGTAQSQLKAEIAPTPQSPNEARLWIDRRIAETILIEHITPEPSSASVADGGYLYSFTTESPQQPVTVFFHVIPQERGLIRGRVGTSPAQSMALWQFILP